MKRFPIQSESWRESKNGPMVYVSWWIPWKLAEQVYKIYHARHASQSLETLCQRSGFGAGELWEMITHGTYGEIGDNYPSSKELAEFMNGLEGAERK